MNIKAMRAAMMSLLLISLPTLAPAQAKEASWENLQQLRVGQEIQVVEKSLKKHNGTFTGYSEESIGLRVKNDDIGVRRENVLRVSNRERTHRGRNVLIGVAIGGGTGLAIGAGIYSKLKGKIGGDTKYPFLLGPIGAGAGGGIGAAIPSYQTVYRAPK